MGCSGQTKEYKNNIKNGEIIGIDEPEMIMQGNLIKKDDFMSKVNERYNLRGLGSIFKAKKDVSYETKKEGEKAVENRYLKRNIKKFSLNEFELELIESLPKDKISYICKWCKKMPLLKFSKESQYSWNDFKAIISKHENCVDKTYFSRGHVDPADVIILEKEKFHTSYPKGLDNLKIKDYSDDKSLPFENREDLDKFLDAVTVFNHLKKVISKYNFGDYKKNYVFMFIQYFLTIGLYGFGTLYEYKNAIEISQYLNFYDTKYGNAIEKMNDGDKIYQVQEFILYKKIKKYKKLNEKNLYAFFIDEKTDDNTLNYGIYIDNLGDNFLDESYYNREILKSENNQAKNKKLIFQYQNKKYEEIIELEPFVYLLHLDNDDLIIASYNSTNLQYDFIQLNINCYQAIVLKSKQIFILTENNLLLTEYNNNKNLDIIKSYESFNGQKYSNFKPFCYELLNGDVIISVYFNKFYYFNIKYFNIQTIYNNIDGGGFSDYYRYNDIKITYGIKQNNDINSFIFINRGDFYNINLKNGKVKKVKCSIGDKPELEFDKYYISTGYERDKFQILDRFNHDVTLFRGYFYDNGITDIILLNEEKKLICFISERTDGLGIIIYQIL